MSKYGAVKTEIDGIVFDSKKEAKYYKIFKDKQSAGEISDLQLQVKYELVPAVYEYVVRHLKTKDKLEQKRIQAPINYVADFVYKDNSSGEVQVVDVKGFRTAAYKLKKKMMLAFKGINIIEY